MNLDILSFAILLTIYRSNAAVYIWSNHQMRISPLQPFTMKEFSEIINALENPEVYIFKSPSKLSPEMKEVTNGFYTAYNPNGDLNTDNSTDLLGDTDLDIIKIKEVIGEKKATNVLSAIVIPNIQRIKRDVEETLSQNNTQKLSTSDSPVIYKGQNTNNHLYSLLYSSKPLLFKKNDTELHLGNTRGDMIIYDSRLNVHVIPIEGGEKVTLRFSFSRVDGYWYMPAVKITDIKNNRDYNLTTDENIMAPDYFSYHCNGFTVFSDTNGVELYIYDLQVQTDSRDGKFGDTNDCVTFTTAPIWSGLFVTTLLGIGLIIGLTAMMDIKTMDKYDNQKTKNLSIRVFE